MKQALAIGGLALLSVAAAPARAGTLHVFAAASLTDAFGEIGAAYEKAHPSVTVEFSFAGSQVLETQIEQGAPADVFASADLAHAEAVQKAGLIGDVKIFTRNRLVVAVPSQGARVAALRDLAKPGVKIVVAGGAVPVGRYTNQVLERLSADGLYGDDFQARVRANVVSEEANVRAVLAKVALGEADAGFVYATDAAGSDKVRVVAVPDRYNVVAGYAIGAVTRSPAPDDAKAFVAFVLAPQGQAILGKYAFGR